MGTKVISRVKSFLPPGNLLPVLFSYTLDSIANSLYWTFFAIWLSEELTDSFFILSLVIAVPPLLSLIGTTILSPFSDRTGRRKEFMFLSRVVLMAQYLLVIFFDQSIWVVLLILGSTGIFTRIYYVMSNTLATTLCHPDRRGEISGFQLFFSSIGWMIGSGISGVVYDYLGITGCLAFAAGAAFLSGFLALFSLNKPVREEMVDWETLMESDSKGTPSGLDKVSGVATVEQRVLRIEMTSFAKDPQKPTSFFGILKRPQIIALLASIGILEFCLGPFSNMASVYLKQIVGLSVYLISLANTLATLCGMIALFFFGKLLDRYGRKPFFIFSILSYSTYFTLFYFLSDYKIVIFVLWLVPLYAFRAPTVNAMMSDLTSENERARGMALVQYEQIFTTNIGAIIGGLIADRVALGLKVIPLSIAVVSIVAFLVALLTIKETNVKYLERKKKEKEQMENKAEQSSKIEG